MVHSFLLVISSIDILQVVDDIIKEVCPPNHAATGHMLDMSDVYVEVVEGRLVVDITLHLVARYIVG